MTTDVSDFEYSPGEEIANGMIHGFGVVVAVVAERLKRPDCARGWLLDGFPRSAAQAEALDGRLGGDSYVVLYFDVPEETVVERLAGRRVCSKCGCIYQVKFNPPLREGVCDRCGGELLQRDDDRTETVRRRLRTYEEQTSSLIERYERSGALVKLEAAGAQDDVLRRVKAALDRWESR